MDKIDRQVQFYATLLIMLKMLSLWQLYSI